jgi:hypothetical protein
MAMTISPEHDYNARIRLSDVEDVLNITMRQFSSEIVRVNARMTEILIWLNSNVEWSGYSYRILDRWILDVWFLREVDCVAFALKFSNHG